MHPFILRASGALEFVTPKNGAHFTLDELQSFVGGYIEILATATDNIVLVINEEGKLVDNPVVNLGATSIYRYGERDTIVGDVLVCPASMVR